MSRATATREPSPTPPVLLSLDQVAVDSLYSGIRETPTLCHLEHIAKAIEPFVSRPRQTVHGRREGWETPPLAEFYSAQAARIRGEMPGP